MFKNKNYVEGPQSLLVPVKLNFGEFMLEKMWKFKDNVCWINAATHKSTKYGTIVQESMNIAVSLAQLGVRKGHTVGICSENTVEYWGAVIGSICVGATLTTFNVGYSKGELKHVMNISKPRVIFCSALAFKLHEKSFRSAEFVKKIIVFGEETHPNTLSYKDLVTPNGFLKANVMYDEFKVADVKGEDTAFVLYSSGTTGLPKGVMLSHLNVVAACSMPFSTDPKMVTITITPWYHTMGLIGSMFGMTSGRSAVFMAKFDVELYLKTIEEFKVSQLTVVPPVLVAISKIQTSRDLSSVAIVLSGAAPLHKDVIEILQTKFPKASFFQGYGMTEATLAVTRDTYEQTRQPKQGSVGYVVSDTTVKVVDVETRKPLGPNQSGELCVKGPMIMKGYVDKQSRDDFDEEGFFKTGDIGYYDEDKCFFIVDRLKELIKYKGYQVPPAEIEALLLQHVGIKDVGVIGIPDKLAGEVPLAFVVPQPGWKLTEKDVKTYVAERLSNPKHLRGGVRFVEQIPKSPSGKILRKDLKMMYNKRKSKL